MSTSMASPLSIHTTAKVVDSAMVRIRAFASDRIWDAPEPVDAHAKPFMLDALNPGGARDMRLSIHAHHLVAEINQGTLPLATCAAFLQRAHVTGFELERRARDTS